MIILNQQKDRIISNFQDVSIRKKFLPSPYDTHELYACWLDSGTTLIEKCIGTFSSKEKAQRVLLEIFNSMERGEKSYQVPTLFD